MSAQQIKIRRAEVNDLENLRAFWKKEEVYSLDLEKVFTEFQLLFKEDEILGCVRLTVIGKEGVVQSLLLQSIDDQVGASDLVWSRIEKIAENHGLVRIWIGKELGPIEGFSPVDAELKSKVEGRRRIPIDGYVKIIKEDVESLLSPEKEFELFQQTIVGERERLLEGASKWRRLALATCLLILSVLMIYALANYFVPTIE